MVFLADGIMTKILVKLGYYSDVLNDTEWQEAYPELYNTLSKYICPSFCQFVQDNGNGIVAGNCISLDTNCNNSIVDNLMGIPQRTYDPVNISTEDDEVIENAGIVAKNIANHEALSNTISKLLYTFNKPSIETFENANDTTGSVVNNSENTEEGTDTDADTDAECEFNIETKCYNQYVEANKNYYTTGADTFNNIFASVDKDVFLNIYNNLKSYISDRMGLIKYVKLISGIIAIILCWSVNSDSDIRIRIFKSFIAFIFSEIYVLYSIYKYILQPAFATRTPVLV